MPASGLLALVQPDLPRSPDGLRALAAHDVEFHGHIVRLGELCCEIEKLPNAEQQRTAFVKSLITTPGRPEDKNLYRSFASRIETVRTAGRDLCRRYMPMRYLQRFYPVQSETHQNTADPVTLLLDGFRPISNAQYHSAEERHAAFEARRDLVLALLYWELMHTKRIGRRYALEDRDNLESFLLEKGIIGRALNPILVQSLHDPSVMRTVWVEYFHGSKPPGEERLIRRSTRLQLTGLCLSSDRVIPIAVEVRRKRFLQIVGKMLVTQGEGVQDVEDRRGLRFVYATLEDLQEGAAFFRGLLPLADFMTSSEGYRDTTNPQAPLLSRFVTKNLAVITYFRSLVGHRTQVQHALISHHLDLIYSRGGENHALYHLRQYTAGPPTFEVPGLFFWMFPPKIYSVSWNDPTVFKELEHHVLALLSP